MKKALFLSIFCLSTILSTGAQADDSGTLIISFNGNSDSVTVYSQAGCTNRVVYCVNEMLSAAVNQLPGGYQISNIQYYGPTPASFQIGVYNSEVLSSPACDVSSVLNAAVNRVAVTDISQLQMVFDRSKACPK